MIIGWKGKEVSENEPSKNELSENEPSENEPSKNEMSENAIADLPLAIGVDGSFWPRVENVRRTHIASFLRPCLTIQIMIMTLFVKTA